MISFVRWFTNNFIRIGTDLLCQIDKKDLSKVPARGPLILVTNHINSLEVPLLFVHLQPRKMIGLAKIETWHNKLMGWLFDLWEAIPVRRGEADLDAIRACLGVLERGDILAVAPEGTRSYHGRLLCGQPGIVLLALRSGAPILPIAHWGGENFGSNIKKLKRTPFHIRVGKQFRVDIKGKKVNSAIRKEIVTEIMGQLANLMPEEYHGEYAGSRSPTKYLVFS